MFSGMPSTIVKVRNGTWNIMSSNKNMGNTETKSYFLGDIQEIKKVSSPSQNYMCCYNCLKLKFRRSVAICVKIYGLLNNSPTVRRKYVFYITCIPVHKFLLEVCISWYGQVPVIFYARDEFQEWRISRSR